MTKRETTGGGGAGFRVNLPIRGMVGPMRVPPAILGLALAALTGMGCAIPDVVLRPDHHFTKSSSITLVSEIPGDPAMFKPELEKELIRRGYNVISDTTAAVVEQERRTGDSDAAIAAAKEAQRLEVAGKGKYGQLTESQTVKKLSSDYSGNIRYLYDVGDHEVRRVNFTIVELNTGTIVASIGYERGGKNVEIAGAIANQLDLALRGVKPAGWTGAFGSGSNAS